MGRELDEMEAAGILERVSHNRWAAPIVPLPKKNGKIRICRDFKVTINPVLQIDQYPLLKPDNLFTTLVGGQKFTVRSNPGLPTNAAGREYQGAGNNQHTSRTLS